MYLFAAVQQTSAAELPAFLQRFLKTVRASRVNETKLISINAFIGNLFALGTEEVSKNDIRNFFGGFSKILNLSVNLQTPNTTYIWFSGLF